MVADIQIAFRRTVRRELRSHANCAQRMRVYEY